MTFDEAKLRKFEEGRRVHKDSEWNADQVNARKEAMDELIDLSWYADLLDDEVLKVRIQLWCRDIWTELEDIGEL